MLERLWLLRGCATLQPLSADVASVASGSTALYVVPCAYFQCIFWSRITYKTTSNHLRTPCSSQVGQFTSQRFHRIFAQLYTFSFTIQLSRILSRVFTRYLFVLDHMLRVVTVCRLWRHAPVI